MIHQKNTMASTILSKKVPDAMYQEPISNVAKEDVFDTASFLLHIATAVLHIAALDLHIARLKPMHIADTIECFLFSLFKSSGS